MHESAQKPSTQKPVPARKVQQSLLTVQLELTARHVEPHDVAGAHARLPLTRCAQHPLLQSELRTHESAQRPLTHEPLPRWKLQQSPLTEQMLPVATHELGGAASRTHSRPAAMKPGSHSQYRVTPLMAHDPWKEQVTEAHGEVEPHDAPNSTMRSEGVSWRSTSRTLRVGRDRRGHSPTRR